PLHVALPICRRGEAEQPPRDRRRRRRHLRRRQRDLRPARLWGGHRPHARRGRQGRRMNTCDLCDRYEGRVRVLDLALRDFGGRIAFAGTVSTVKALEDNSRVREAVAEPGHGRVLVIDGGGSLRRAMLGDMLAEQALAGGWSGVLVHGAVRDAAALAGLGLGIKALGTCPRRTDKL